MRHDGDLVSHYEYDLNGNRKYDVGEQTGTPVVTAVVVNGAILTSIDPNFSRPYTDEYSFGVDRELRANMKLSAVYTYRREKNTQASYNPDNPYDKVLTSAVDPGLDGVVGGPRQQRWPGDPLHRDRKSRRAVRRGIIPGS